MTSVSNEMNGDPLAVLVLACEEALADGAPLPLLDPASVPAGLLPRLVQARECLEALELIWPRSGQDDTPQNRKTLEISHYGDTIPAGQQFGRFQLVREIGRGGCGIVFLALDSMLRREIVLKVLRPELIADVEMRQRFLREAQAAAAIENDHIVTIYQVGEEGGVPFLAMQYLRGETLEERLQREGSLPVSEVLRIGQEIAAGLAAAHRRGLIHRDVKPANIWLETPEALPAGSSARHARAKILDFGMAHAAENSQHLTATGMLLGTPAYMAPEQARGTGVDHRSDQFSLGCLLYRMSTGQLPFRGINTFALLDSITSESPRLPRQLKPEVPQALSDVVMKALSKRPEDRYASVQDLQAALAAVSLADEQGLQGYTFTESRSAPVPASGAAMTSHIVRPDAAPPEMRLVVYTTGQPIQIWPLDPQQVCLVGRGALARLQLEDPFVSRLHCQIEARGSRWVLTDVGSSTGTRVNGERVKRCLINVGDEISIGKTRLNAIARGETSDSSTEIDDPPASLDEFVGRTIDRFIAVDVLAHGTHSNVFLALDVERNTDVAIKVMFPVPGEGDRYRERFIRAVQFRQSMTHAHIVELYLAGRIGPYCWLAMEYVPGDNARQIISRSGAATLPHWSKTYRVALQLSRALEVSNAHQLMHRGITPRRVLIRASDESAKLAGLMLARNWADSASDIYPLDEPPEELAYLAPERVLKTSAADARTEIYELGAVLYGLITGSPPVEGHNVDTVLKNIATAVPPSPGRFQPSLSKAFEGAILRMVARKPEDRYQSASELVADLEQIGRNSGKMA